MSVSELGSEALLDTAVDMTGLTDFGDGSFLEGLGVLQRACAREANLSPRGVAETRNARLRALVNRLLVEELLARRPEILETPIVRPIIIVGLPRTGTTFLQQLLAVPRSVWAPSAWELVFPVTPRDEDVASLVEKTDKSIQAYYERAPILRDIHGMGASEPDECHRLMRHTFTHSIFEMMHHVPSYSEWLDGQSMDSVYAYFRKLLQVLRWRRPGGRVVLKCPFHIFNLRTVLRTFPDALLVMIHRDPCASLASLCSMTRAIHGIRSDVVHCDAIGRHWQRRVKGALAGFLLERTSVRSEQLVEVAYAELTTQPSRVARRVLAVAGLDWNVEDEAPLAQRVCTTGAPRPRHVYSLEDFGLRLPIVQRELADYRDAIGQESASDA